MLLGQRYGGVLSISVNGLCHIYFLLHPKSHAANPLPFKKPECRLDGFIAPWTIVVSFTAISQIKKALPALHYALLQIFGIREKTLTISIMNGVVFFNFFFELLVTNLPAI